MLRKDKVAVVDQLKKKLENAGTIFLTDFTGINVQEINKLRRDFREVSVEYLVAKNTLIKRAIADTPLEQLDSYLRGPTALVIAEDDGVQAAKVITGFAREHDTFTVKVGVTDNKLISPEEVKAIASLPSKEVLLAKMLGSLNSPIANLVFVLHDTVGRVVRLLDQIRQAKESKGE